ncbi:hypothetical protein HDK90DRAFT_183315 [Phyllosticta capitalensis]|uniref:Uncharacterized protein n=1 Tax=Phyllosticta capitalensis TaxID=121624 RepID=A0ABR1YW23_9PEZI
MHHHIFHYVYPSLCPSACLRTHPPTTQLLHISKRGSRREHHHQTLLTTYLPHLTSPPPLPIQPIQSVIHPSGRIPPLPRLTSPPSILLPHRRKSIFPAQKRSKNKRDGRLDGWMDGWMDGPHDFFFMIRCKHIHTPPSALPVHPSGRGGPLHVLYAHAPHLVPRCAAGCCCWCSLLSVTMVGCRILSLLMLSVDCWSDAAKGS